MNKVWIVGRLGQDPQVRAMQSGAKVMNFSVATSKRWTDKNGQKQEKTEWHRCTLFGKIVDHMEQMLRKGTTVAIEGMIETDQYTDKNGQAKSITQIRVGDIELIAGYGQQDRGEPRGNTPPPRGNDAPPASNGGGADPNW